MKHYPVAIVADDFGNAIPLTQPNPPSTPQATHLTFPVNAVLSCVAPLCPTPFGKRGFWLEETANGWLVIVRERVSGTEDPPTYGFETISKHVCKTSVEVLLLLAARMTSSEMPVRLCEPQPPPPPPVDRHAPYLPRPFPPKDITTGSRGARKWTTSSRR